MLFNDSTTSPGYVPSNNGTPQETNGKTLALTALFLSQAYLKGLPVFCIIGIIGNVLAFFVFVSKPMRRTSCSLYLAARSITDGGFLATTFITWISDATKTQFIHTHGWCQLTVFFSYVFAFLSVWLTVVITCENYIRICRPFSVSNYCNVPKAKRAIFVLVLISLVLYNFPLWTNNPEGHTGADNSTSSWCLPHAHFSKFVKWMSLVDNLLTLILPSLIIILLMVAITVSLVKSIKRQSRLQSNSTTRGQGSDANGTGPSNGRQQRSSSSPQAKVTRMLFLVSLLFILLNSPSHIIRAKMAIQQFYGVPKRKSPSTEELCQVAFQIVFYISFGVNLLVYLVCGDNFRKVFQERYMSLCLSRNRSPQPEMTALTTVRLEETDRRPDDQTALIQDKGVNSSSNTESPIKGSNNGHTQSSVSNNSEAKPRASPPQSTFETRDTVATLNNRQLL